MQIAITMLMFKPMKMEKLKIAKILLMEMWKKSIFIPGWWKNKFFMFFWKTM